MAPSNEVSGESKMGKNNVIVLLAGLIICSGSQADCFTPNCEYEKDKAESDREWQEQREEKYERWDFQQRKRDPYSVDSPPPPYGV